jgi:YVTN family beta-propeller protein
MNPTPRSLATVAIGLLSAAPWAGASPSGLLLVANKGDHTLSIVDAAAGLQVAAIDEDGNTGHEVAVSPDGRRAFVPIYGNSGVGRAGTDGQLVRVIDLQNRSIVGTIDFGRPARPHRPVIGPKNGMLYVTTELQKSVSIIDPASLRVVGSIPTGQEESHMLAITSDGRRGYTANVKSGTVSALDLEARTLVATIPIAPHIQRISISVDDRWVFTADQTKLRLVAIDAARNTVAASIPLPGLAFGTAPTPDGKTLLAAIPALSMVAQVDVSTMRVVRTLEVPKSPQEILVRPDGAVAYVSCDQSAQVAVINLADWRVERLIGVGRVDDGLAWVPAN